MWKIPKLKQVYLIKNMSVLENSLAGEVRMILQVPRHWITAAGRGISTENMRAARCGAGLLMENVPASSPAHSVNILSIDRGPHFHLKVKRIVLAATHRPKSFVRRREIHWPVSHTDNVYRGYDTWIRSNSTCPGIPGPTRILMELYCTVGLNI